MLRRVSGAFRGREALWALLPLLAGLLVFGPRITGGGFTADDWSNRAFHMSVAEVPNFQGEPFSHRWLHLPYASIYDEAFGSATWAYLLWGVFTAGLLGVLVVQLLRRLGVPAPAAAAVGTLGVVFPYASITKIWFTAHVGHVSGALVVGGLLVALRGIDLGGRRGAALHGLAGVLFLTSLFLYEIALGLVLVSGPVYLVYARRGRSRAAAVRAAAPRWAFDLALVGFFYLRARAGTNFGGQSTTPLADRLQLLVEDGARNVLGAFVPFLADEVRDDGNPIYSGAWFDVGPSLAALVAVLVFGVALVVSGRARRFAEAGARRWGVGVLLSVVAAFLGWLAIVPANDYYRPVPLDTEALRVNVLAAFGLAAVVVTTVGGGLSVLRALAPQIPRRWTAVAGGAALLLVAVTYVRHVQFEVKIWNQASDEQLRVVDATTAALGPAADDEGLKVVLTDNRNFVPGGAEIFFTSWSLPGALRTKTRNFGLEAVPYRPAGQYQCRDEGLALFHLQYRFRQPDVQPLSYGPTTYVVSVERRRSWRVTSQKQCDRLLRSLGLQVLDENAETPALGGT